MSPEQASGQRELDARTDIYSLGLVLYEMLAGETPFAAPTAQAMIARRFMESPEPVRQLRDAVAEHVEQALQKALARTAADRFSSAAEFAAALGPGAGSTASTRAPAAATSTGGTVYRHDADLSPRPARPRRRVPVAAASLTLGFVLGLGLLFGWLRRHGNESPGEGGAKRLAVLPFENLGAAGDEYFADGITDEVRGKLAALPGLQVTRAEQLQPVQEDHQARRRSDASWGWTTCSPARFAGRRPRAANHVRVSPELIRVSTGSTKWQQPFDAALTDVFKVQGEMAGQVAQALDLALATPQRAVLAAKPTANAAAYDAYLKGEAASLALGSGDPRLLRTAIGHYEQAVALDSGFVQAWVELSRAHSLLYINGSPDPASAHRAREGAERALRLSANQPGAHLALGDYFTAVVGDQERARAAFEAGLRLAPNDADLLGSSAKVELITGKWEEALGHFRRAQSLDPRSFAVARRLSNALVRLRRYPEALAATDRALALAPDNVAAVQNKALVFLAQGDLEGARRLIREAPPTIDPTDLVAIFANFWDLYWVLTPDQQALLRRLTPSAFPDRSSWAIVMAQTYRLQGDRLRARAYADSALAAFAARLADTPNDAQSHAFRGLALAYLGRKAEAIAEGERGVALVPIARDSYTGPYLQHQLVRIYIETGEFEKALDKLEPLLEMPYNLSPGWLRIDPNFDPLRKQPRFQKLVEGATGVAAVPHQSPRSDSIGSTSDARHAGT